MTRISPRLVQRAQRISPNLAALLPACRSLQSASNELRWLHEHVQNSTPVGASKTNRLAALCRQRGHGVPLQYILGSQPFGPLDILCKPGVLIPRPETEAYVFHLASLIQGSQLRRITAGDKKGLNIIDLCTGTGCIPLLLYSLLQRNVSQLNVRGLDLARNAVDLASLNIHHNIKLGNMVPINADQKVSISQGDVFNDEDIRRLSSEGCDVLISNPPYISQNIWDYGRGQIGYSVRKYEPRLALVPSPCIPTPAHWQHQDVFYARLFDVILLLKPMVALFELGDEAQARRVLAGLMRHEIGVSAEVEVWRDWPDLGSSDDGNNSLTIQTNGQTRIVMVKGNGQIRSIYLSLTWCN